MAGPFTSRNGLPHNRGRKFYKCQGSGCGLGGQGKFLWADGTMPFSAESCRRVEKFYGQEEDSVGVGPIFGLVADHLDDEGRPVGPYHVAKRRKVEHEGSDAEADDSNVDEESDASDDSGEQAERREQALQCECVRCGESHPDPEQLLEDDPEINVADMPSEKDSNGWRVCSDDWSVGMCPECQDSDDEDEDAYDY